MIAAVFRGAFKGAIVGIIVGTLIGMCSNLAEAQSHFHSWTLMSKSYNQTNGRTYCQWVCEGLNGGHVTVTSGFGDYCPSPY